MIGLLRTGRYLFKPRELYICVAQLKDGYFLEGLFPAVDKLGHISIHTGSHIDPWTNEMIA
jgi:hypothetical protein